VLSTTSSPEQPTISKVPTASGVANNDGRLRWPLGLRTLGGPQAGHQPDELRGRLERLFQQAAEQAPKGPADFKLLDAITRTVNRFRTLFIQEREERGGLAANGYDEADRFLNQLVKAAAVLRAGVHAELSASR
jgi:hypothetical protein